MTLEERLILSRLRVAAQLVIEHDCLQPRACEHAHHHWSNSCAELANHESGGNPEDRQVFTS